MLVRPDPLPRAQPQEQEFVFGERIKSPMLMVAEESSSSAPAGPSTPSSQPQLPQKKGLGWGRKHVETVEWTDSSSDGAGSDASDGEEAGVSAAWCLAWPDVAWTDSTPCLTALLQAF